MMTEWREGRRGALHFQADEIGQFFAQTMQLDLSAGNVAVLEARTEGWIAGLQMAGLSLQGQADITTYLDQFSGSQRYIFDYLADQVLSHCTPEIRDFLLRTAVLERMCASLCDALLETEASQTMLVQLEEANFFLTPLDDERHWYRYHHLFADLLRRQLRREMPEAEAELHSRASRWFEEAGSATKAIEHALKADEVARAAALIEPLAHGMAYRMEVETLGRWVEALPDKLLLRHAGIVYPYAIVLSINRRFTEYDRYLVKAEESALANIDKPEAQITLGQVGVHKSIQRHLFGEYEQALAQVSQTQNILRQYGQPDERWELISIVGYSTIHTRGEADFALAYLEQATRLGSVDEGPTGALLGNTFTANAYFYLGRLPQVESALQTALRAVTRPDGSKLFMAVFPSALLARLAYERNQLDEAARYVEMYLPLTDITGFTTDPLDTLFVGTMLPLAQGDSDQAIAALREAEIQFQALPISPQCRTSNGRGNGLSHIERNFQMSPAKVIRSNEGQQCQISSVENVQLKVSGDETGGSLDFVVDEAHGPPLHFHETLDEVFYILSGEMRFQIGDEMIDVQAGDTVYVPKGVSHAFTNLQQSPAKMIGVIAPGGFDTLRELLQGDQLRGA